MSRLESFIRRMTAQRIVLDAVCAEVTDMQGPILELGLGNGRTYDHLRERLPGRRIIAFDRALAAHPSSVPPESDLVIGEIRETAARFAGIRAALVHADIGTGIEELDLKTQQWLPGLAVSLLQSGGIAVSGLPLDHAGLQPLPLCDGVPAGRYFIYRKAV
ncbi:class I SAM-dependent methyltransferase [Mesorhizobium sp. IMUNJ 23232]|uniref:class I SAM-dependent methyltransferase n=1 Tax=Mesorhizobium sp. IMUNJ 23232 TaxID=3376064 RepID=UPI0037B13C4C